MYVSVGLLIGPDWWSGLQTLKVPLPFLTVHPGADGPYAFSSIISTISPTINVPVDPSLPSSFRIWSNFGVIEISGDLYCPKNE